MAAFEEVGVCHELVRAAETMGWRCDIADVDNTICCEKEFKNLFSKDGLRS
jgi:hypothetical protein